MTELDSLRVSIARRWNTLANYIEDDNWPKDFVADVVKAEALSGKCFDYDNCEWYRCEDEK